MKDARAAVRCCSTTVPGMPYAEWTSTVLTPLGVKEDVVIPGVGWMSLSGTCGQIRVTHPQTLEIKHRKAMI